MFIFVAFSFVLAAACFSSFRAGKRSQRARIELAYELGMKAALNNKGDLIRKAYSLGVAKGRNESRSILTEPQDSFQDS